MNFTFEVKAINNADQVLVEYVPEDSRVAPLIRRFSPPIGLTEQETKEFFAKAAPISVWERQISFLENPAALKAVSGSQADIPIPPPPEPPEPPPPYVPTPKQEAAARLKQNGVAVKNLVYALIQAVEGDSTALTEMHSHITEEANTLGISEEAIVEILPITVGL